jgi:hypothetical protein
LAHCAGPGAHNRPCRAGRPSVRKATVADSFIADLAEGKGPRKARGAAERGGADRHSPRIFIGNDPGTASPEFSDRNDFRRCMASARMKLKSSVGLEPDIPILSGSSLTNLLAWVRTPEIKVF